MKKSFLWIVCGLLAMAGCTGDGDNPESEKILTIDGESYYNGSICQVNRSDGSGMYLDVLVVEDKYTETTGKILIVYISPSTVSELSVGQFFMYYDLSVILFHDLNHPDSYNCWDCINGRIIIQSISDKEITIQFDSLIIKHKNSGAEHLINGIVTLHDYTT